MELHVPPNGRSHPRICIFLKPCIFRRLFQSFEFTFKKNGRVTLTAGSFVSCSQRSSKTHSRSSFRLIPSPLEVKVSSKAAFFTALAKNKNHPALQSPTKSAAALRKQRTNGRQKPQATCQSHSGFETVPHPN